MDLHHLRYFVAVAERLHFGEAAEFVHVSQPNVASPLLNRSKAETERRLQGQRANNFLQVCQLAVNLLSADQRLELGQRKAPKVRPPYARLRTNRSIILL